MNAPKLAFPGCGTKPERRKTLPVQSALMKTTIVALNFAFALLTALSLRTSAAPPHAWVAGYGSGPGEFEYWWPDWGDDTPGLLYDTMGATNGSFGRVAGSASIDGTVRIYLRARPAYYLEAYAQLLDTYRFYDMNDPARTGPVPSLHGAVTCSGSLSADKGDPQFWFGFAPVYTWGLFQLMWDGSQHTLRTCIPHDGVDTYQPAGSSVSVSAVFPFDITANFGQDCALDLLYKATDWPAYDSASDSQIDFLNTATLSFYTTDPIIRLGVVSTGRPAVLTARAAGSDLELSWPADRQGWRLVAQTNALSPTNWFTVPDSTTTNRIFVSRDPSVPAVFYRLVLP